MVRPHPPRGRSGSRTRTTTPAVGRAAPRGDRRATGRARADDEVTSAAARPGPTCPRGRRSRVSGAVARTVLTAANTLLASPGLRTFGGWVSAAIDGRQLRQVARYLRRKEADEQRLTLDARIRRRVEQNLDPAGPTLVVAHSLGSVVALRDAARAPRTSTATGHPRFADRHEYGRTAPDAPAAAAGPRSGRAVAQLLGPGRPSSPDSPRLEQVVRANDRSVLPVTRRVDSDGVWVHPAATYLAQPASPGRSSRRSRRPRGHDEETDSPPPCARRRAAVPGAGTARRTGGGGGSLHGLAHGPVAGSVRAKPWRRILTAVRPVRRPGGDRSGGPGCGRTGGAGGPCSSWRSSGTAAPPARTPRST